MRKLTFFLFVVSLALFRGQAHAQRCLPGMKGIRLTAGMADGFYSPSSKNETGYSFGASLATYTKGGHQWVLGAEYLRRYHPYRESRIPVGQFTVEGGFFCDMLSDGSKTFFLSVGISALAGYETVNGGKKLLFDGSTIRNKDGFVYGGAITLQAETYLTDRLVLLLYGRERCLWGGSIGHFHAQYGVGLKIMMDLTMDARRMREIPVADFLNAMGGRPAKQRGQVLWYSTPYRTERTPSFKVDIAKNVWFDFGIGKGGDIFDLAGAFIGSEDFLLRAAFIAKSGACPLPVMTQSTRNKEREPAFEDIWVRSLQDSKLLGYLEERGIDAYVAIPNCEEIRYRVHGKRYYAIGFRNRSGGMELRNRFFKGCIPPKDISLKCNGADVCAVFEGFMDYLSAMQLGIIASDRLMLNSVSNVEKALQVLGDYQRIECYLDNDNAGRRTFDRLRVNLGDKVVDCSSLYAGHKDLNEYLLSWRAGMNV